MKLLRPLDLKSTSGVSILEVLVALGIFMIGGLMVVQLFPGGFASVQRTENSTIGTSLAEMELDRWKSRAANLPAGILGIDPSTGEVMTDADPEDMSELAGRGRYYSDVNKFRHVYAESTKIPAPTAEDWDPADTSSIYVLGFAPIKYTDASSIKVYSNPLRRVPVPDGQWARMRWSDYAIEYGETNGEKNNEEVRIVVSAAPFARTFTISYSYWLDGQGSAPQLVSVVGQTIQVDPGTNMVPNSSFLQYAYIPAPTSGNVADVPGFRSIEADSDTLSRQFTDLTNAQTPWAWSAVDPYQYVMKDPVAGVLAFNPLGYGFQEMTSRGRQPLVAYIDYDVYDWHIIREQKKVPTQPQSALDPYCNMRMALSYMKQKFSSTDQNGDSYTGILPPNTNAPAGWVYFDVLAVDIATGLKFNEASTFTPVGGSAAVSVFKVDYRNGIVRFHKDFAGRTFLICYQADNDWALQPYKSYDAYTRHQAQITAVKQLGYQEYYLQAQDSSGNGQTLDRGMVYFNRCYAGNSVSLDYSYRLNDPQSPVYHVSGETYQVSDTPGAYGLCSVDVLGKLAKSIKRSKNEISIVDVYRVYGVSLGARVVWRDGGSGSILGRWKRVNIQTYLTEAPE